MTKPRSIRYVNDASLTWKRVGSGDQTTYLNRLGKPIRATDQARVRSLVIPPAWVDVRICADPRGHIQATGLDAKGRKQYIYHPDWIAYTQRSKFDSLRHFGEVLPTLRETINGHMRQHTLSRERVLATVVWLLEHTFIRVGNQEYAKQNQSYGLTTMRNKHVDVVGNTVSFSFKGKSHVYHELDVRHPRVAQTIRQCIELPGYQLFQYLDDDQQRHKIDSADVNQYLKDITGESFSAKDFRTWGGTVLAGDLLYQLGDPSDELPAEKNVVQAVKAVSEHLGNTVAVCRQYYIHPKVISSYERSLLIPHFDQVLSKTSSVPEGLSAAEYAVWSLL